MSASGFSNIRISPPLTQSKASYDMLKDIFNSPRDLDKIRNTLNQSYREFVAVDINDYDGVKRPLFDSVELDYIAMTLSNVKLRSELETKEAIPKYTDALDFGKFCAFQNQLYFISNRTIGDGSCKGNVKIAINVDTGQLVAYSEINPLYGNIESRIIQQLRHNASNSFRYLLAPVVDITYQTEDGESKQILMTPYCNCGDLFTYRYRLQKTPLLVRLRVARDILMGILALHEQNLIHSDIKPENVVLHKYRNKINKKVIRAKILDFESCSRNDNFEEKMIAKGTLKYYLSPEMSKLAELNLEYQKTEIVTSELMLAAEQISPKVDIFSAQGTICAIFEDSILAFQEEIEGVKKRTVSQKRKLKFWTSLLTLLDKMKETTPGERPDAQSCIDEINLIMNKVEKHNKLNRREKRQAKAASSSTNN